MKSKIYLRATLLIIIILLGLLPLSGCRLAKEGAGKIRQEDHDQLIGVFITTEHLDLFDMEAYLNDNINSIMSGSSDNSQHTVPENVSQEYNRRIYADINVNGSGDARDYSFDGLDGILMIMPTIYADHPEDTYTTSTSSEEISDISAVFGDHKKLEGTIYVPSQMHAAFFFNPVYQTSEGAIYIIEGDGISGDLSNESAFSKSIKEEYTSTQNEETKTVSMEVSVSIQGKQGFESYDILQMNHNNQCIKTETFTADCIPDTIQAEHNTEYIIVAGNFTIDGKQQKERQIYDISGADQPEIELLVPLENGILAKSMLPLIK